MVLKAISMGVPILVSRSGFTKSAVHLARKFNLSMIGRFKGKRFMCVSGFERILL
jgi:FdhD protein